MTEKSFAHFHSTEFARIARSYAEWTVISALRSGAPIKSREDVYPLLAKIDFDSLFDHALGPIEKPEFEEWHVNALETAIEHSPNPMVHGWAAKIVNVYLKTRGYLSGVGRPGLPALLHPPLDAGLWLGLKARFRDDRELTKRLDLAPKTISEIVSGPRYLGAIGICRAVADRMNCQLIEVEQFWLGAAAGRERSPDVVSPAERPLAVGEDIWLWDAHVHGERRATVRSVRGEMVTVVSGEEVIHLEHGHHSKLGRWRR